MKTFFFEFMPSISIRIWLRTRSLAPPESPPPPPRTLVILILNDAVSDFFPFARIGDLNLFTLLFRNPLKHSLADPHHSPQTPILRNRWCTAGRNHYPTPLSPGLLRPWETITLRGTVAKNWASSCQGIDRSRTASVAGFWQGW
jgi:hypothetical protein